MSQAVRSGHLGKTLTRLCELSIGKYSGNGAEASWFWNDIFWVAAVGCYSRYCGRVNVR